MFTSDRTPKGRGARTNPAGRFERFQVEAFDDGWGNLDELAPAIPTTVMPEVCRTIVTRNESPDVPFDRSINPYRGCEHGCVYCYARPSHAYMGLSPGIDFESRLFAKENAPDRLAAELKRGPQPDPIALGANTDPYQPIERRYRITRKLLQVLAERGQAVAIVTKSNLILRDLDVLSSMAERNLATAMISITTLDRSLARRMEPRAPTPERRLDAVRALNEAGVPAGVLVAPIIPGLTDPELERILEATRDAGARSAGYVLVRLPCEVDALFQEWLQSHVPEKAARVMSLIRQMHGGKSYDASFGRRMCGTGPFAELLRWRFETACRRLGFNGREERSAYPSRRSPADGEAHGVPAAQARLEKTREQLDLFALPGDRARGVPGDERGHDHGSDAGATRR